MRVFEAVWWALAALAAASMITDVIWLDGQIKAWVGLCWVAIAMMSRGQYLMRGQS